MAMTTESIKNDIIKVRIDNELHQLLEYQSNKEAISRADASYAEYKATDQSVSLDQLIKNNALDH